MTDFSTFVDNMRTELRRPDLTQDICSFTNQTVRECHSNPTTNGAAFYRENRKESQIVADVDVGFQWTAPNPRVFQGVNAAQYASVWDHDGPVWAGELSPGPAMNQKRYYFYRTGSTLSFAGYGGVNGKINLAWYEYLPSLSYYAPGSRPATYDPVTDTWTYAPAYDTDPTQRLLGQSLVEHWMLARWSDIIAEGVRAKVFKRTSDDVRSKSSYSLYQQLRHNLFTAETADVSGGV